MIGLDTNVLVRYLTGDDAEQLARIEAFFEKVGDVRLRVDIIVLCEVAWVLRSAYGYDRSTISNALAKLLEIRQISVEDRDIVRQAIRLFRTEKGDFSDYLIGLRNHHAKCTETLTLDKALANSSHFRLL